MDLQIRSVLILDLAQLKKNDHFHLKGEISCLLSLRKNVELELELMEKHRKMNR